MLTNKKAWFTGQMFEDWLTNHFVVEAERYCRQQSLAFKLSLLLGNVPGHPRHLDCIHPNITVRSFPFLPILFPILRPLISSILLFSPSHVLRLGHYHNLSLSFPRSLTFYSSRVLQFPTVPFSFILYYFHIQFFMKIFLLFLYFI